MNHIVVLTGAGMSAESGLKTFRDSGGLWEGHSIEEVASIDGWYRNPDKVLEFYNQRRAQAALAQPNAGHLALAELEKKHRVTIITQNVDDLHEKAGSKNVIHLHGELKKARSTGDPNLIYDIGAKPIHKSDMCEKGFQLRPHIVWFGEQVPLIETAAQLVSEADVLVVIGTSLVVYPAANLIYYTRPDAPCYLIDPGDPFISQDAGFTIIRKTAAEGTPELVKILTEN